MRPTNGLTWFAFAALGIVTSAPAQAQAPSAADSTCPRARAEVRAGCAGFLRTRRWDVGAATHVENRKKAKTQPRGVAAGGPHKSEQECQSPSTPSPDPYVRDYRIRPLPWVVTISRWFGSGWHVRGDGNQWATILCMRFQLRCLA